MTDNDYWRIQAADVLTQLYEAERENARLESQLADDVSRWRESGDGRDLAYVLETMDRYDEAKARTT